jgi:hypothetical protein
MTLVHVYYNCNARTYASKHLSISYTKTAYVRNMCVYGTASGNDYAPGRNLRRHLQAGFSLLRLMLMMTLCAAILKATLLSNAYAHARLRLSYIRSR